MGAVTTLVATVAAAAGAVALYRFIDNKAKDFKSVLSEAKRQASGETGKPIIDYERDPESGVFKPKH